MHCLSLPRRSEDPSTFKNQINYALWLHAVALNPAGAKAQYLSMPLKHPLALAACGIFLLSQNNEPRDLWWNQAQVRCVAVAVWLWLCGCGCGCVALRVATLTVCVALVPGSQPECPLCRQPCTPQTLLCLQGY